MGYDEESEITRDVQGATNRYAVDAPGLEPGTFGGVPNALPPELCIHETKMDSRWVEAVRDIPMM